MSDISSGRSKALSGAGDLGISFAARRFSSRSIAGLSLAMADAVTVQLILLVAVASLQGLFPSSAMLVDWDPTMAAAMGLSSAATNQHVGVYDTAGRGPIERFRLRMIGAATAPWPALALLAMVHHDGFVATAVLALASLLWFPGTLMSEALVRRALLQRAEWGARALLVGNGRAVARLSAHLQAHPELGLRPVLNPAQAEFGVVALSAETSELDLARLPFRRIIVVPDVAGLPELWLSSRGLGGAAGLEFSNRMQSQASQRAKRAFDLAIAVPSLLASLLPMLLFALCIKVVSPGPAFFTQQRVGWRGRPVRIFKLRTMHLDAEHRLQALLDSDAEARREWEEHVKLSHDPRILPVIGAFLRRSSLDELPQLWNVVRGDISLVGPRPFPDYHVSRFGAEFQALRASVKPGLTGLWQVSDRSDADLRQQQAIDTFYISNSSLWVDLYVVVNTLPAMLSARGAR